MGLRGAIVGSVLCALAVPAAQAQLCTANTTTAYFVPSYAGWDTAKRTWTGSAGGTSYDRWFSYATNKYEHIKFSDPHSAETYTIGTNGIYITAENDINDTSDSRVWPSSGTSLGLFWLPLVAYSCPGCSVQTLTTCLARNNFDPCYSSVNYYTNCLLTSSTGQHCGLYGSEVLIESYNYGYSVGILPSLIKRDILDNLQSEKYYYGLGRGLLRYELYDASGNLLNWTAQTGEVADEPIADEACFHP